MHKSKGRWGGRTRRTRVGKREEQNTKETRTNAWKADWNIRGSNAPGQEVRVRDGPGEERPGLQKEEEAVTARSGKENMNKSKERWRGRTRRTRIGKKEEKEKKGEADKDMETGLEHPGKKCTRTGTSGW